MKKPIIAYIAIAIAIVGVIPAFISQNKAGIIISCIVATGIVIAGIVLQTKWNKK